MKMPSKVNSFSESVIALFTPILERLQEQPMTPHDLFNSIKATAKEMGRFLDALDCLYAVGKIEIPEGTEELRYVETSNV